MAKLNSINSIITPQDNAIAITDICKSFGKIKALDNVSLSIPKGELFGLIGPDGAGKSTLYRILTTLDRPNSGQATVGGFDTIADYRAIRRSIGYMPEKFSLYGHLTVKENLEFFASIFGVKVRDSYQLIAPIFSQLEKFPNRKASALSGGMKQKLALSCALIHRPEILLLDEPTTGVDAVSRSEFWDMLATLRQRGMTIMVSTSYMDEAERCDRLALINNGKILGVDSPQGLVAQIHEPIYEASASNMFALLNKLQSFPEIKECYTFGASIHIVGSKDFNAKEVEQKLKNSGIPDPLISETHGDIEDLFIKLMQRTNDNAQP